MAYKLFNPDPAEFKVTVRKIDGSEVAKVSIPAKGYAIVSSIDGIVDVYPQIQISPATEEEYEAYRKEVARMEKEAEAAAVKAAQAAVEEAEAEAARIEAKIKERADKEVVARKAALAEKLGIIKSAGEEPLADVEQPRRGRPKKGE